MSNHNMNVDADCVHTLSTYPMFVLKIRTVCVLNILQIFATFCDLIAKYCDMKMHFAIWKCIFRPGNANYYNLLKYFAFEMKSLATYFGVL